MKNSNNGKLFLDSNSKNEIHDQLMIKKNNKLVNQGLEITDPIISKISKLINTKRIVSQSSYKHLLEFPISMTNNDLQKRKIDRIKENIANNQKQNQILNLHNLVKSNLDMDQQQRSRGNNGSLSKHKNKEFLTVECLNKEEEKKKVHENHLVKLNFRDLLQQMRIKSSHNISNRMGQRRIVFNISKINQKKYRNNLAYPNNNPLRLIKNRVDFGSAIQSNNHLIELRPETTSKINSTKNLICERPLSRYNKNTLFAKIESNSDLKEEAFFPIKNMNLDFGFDNNGILPQSWK